METHTQPTSAPGKSISEKRAIVIDEAKLIYVEVARVACTSIKQALGEAFNRSEEEILTWRGGKMPIVDLRDPKYDDYFRFTFVRNPWDRFVSSFENKFNHPRVPEWNLRYHARMRKRLGEDAEPTFENFIKYVDIIPDVHSDFHWRSQYLAIVDRELNPLVHFVGRYESLEKDFNTICSRAGIQAKLPRLHASSHRDSTYHGYFDDFSRNFVAKRFQIDIEMFGYEF